MGTHGGAPPRTLPAVCFPQSSPSPGSSSLPSGSPASNAPCQELGVQPPCSKAGSRGAGERRPRTCLRRADPLLRDAAGAPRLVWLAAHHQRGGPAPCRRTGTSSAAVPCGGGDSGGKPGETTLEVLGAGGQKRPRPLETRFFRLSLPQAGGLRFPAPDTPGPRPQPSRPGSHSSSRPAETARFRIWKPPFLGLDGLPGLPSRAHGAGSPSWTPRSASGRS